MSYTGKKFPSISVPAMDKTGNQSEINIVELAKAENKKVLLFWYPKDFTFVCPTEIHAFNEKLAEFEKRNTIVIGASCDTAEVHFAWLNTPKNKGGIEGVNFPLLADSNRNLSAMLDILDSQLADYDEETGFQLLEGDHVSYRATYLIDEEGIVFYEGVNHMPIGRNVDELIRLVDAYAHVQENGEVCPANWNKGETAMNANLESVSEYLAAHQN